MSKLSSTFNGDFKPAPSPFEHGDDTLRTDVPQLEQPGDYSVLDVVFYRNEPSLKASPGALNTPMGTGIPNPKTTR